MIRRQRLGACALTLLGVGLVLSNGCVAALVEETTIRQYSHVDDQDPHRLDVDVSLLPPGSVQITEEKTRHGTIQFVNLKPGMPVRILVLPATGPSTRPH
jgi:hypothetical protein